MLLLLLMVALLLVMVLRLSSAGFPRSLLGVFLLLFPFSLRYISWAVHASLGVAEGFLLKRQRQRPRLSPLKKKQTISSSFFPSDDGSAQLSSALRNISSKRFRRVFNNRVPSIQSFQSVYRCIQSNNLIKGNHPR